MLALGLCWEGSGLQKGCCTAVGILTACSPPPHMGPCGAPPIAKAVGTYPPASPAVWMADAPAPGTLLFPPSLEALASRVPTSPLTPKHLSNSLSSTQGKSQHGNQEEPSSANSARVQRQSESPVCAGPPSARPQTALALRLLQWLALSQHGLLLPGIVHKCHSGNHTMIPVTWTCG